MEERLISILRLALKYKVKDIHFMFRNTETNISMRIDNEPKKVKAKYDDYKLQRYLCYLGNLNVSENMKPQTSSFEMVVDEQLLHLRIATILDNNVGSMVLRIVEL